MIKTTVSSTLEKAEALVQREKEAFVLEQKKTTVPTPQGTLYSNTVIEGTLAMLHIYTTSLPDGKRSYSFSSLLNAADGAPSPPPSEP